MGVKKFLACRIVSSCFFSEVILLIYIKGTHISPKNIISNNSPFSASSLSLHFRALKDMAEEVILLDFWPSPFVMRARIALREKGVDFDSREEDLSNKSSLLLKMNPVHKQIPVLIHKGRSVCESSIIVQYIDEVWSHKSPLLPSDPYKRSQSRFWVDYVDKKVIPTARLIWDAAPEEVQEATKKELLQSFKLLEDELGDKIYFGGDNFGFVDVCLIPLYSLFYAIEMSAGFSIAEECPKLVAWAKGCMQRESVSETLPDQYKVYDFLRERKEKKKKKTQTK